MKRVYVRAFCQSNLGDDLFVLQLAKRYPETKFYVYALGANQNAFLGQHNIVLPSKWDRVHRKLTHSLHLSREEAFDGQGLDGTVVIGGSILWEGADIDFARSGTPCYLIGANCESGYSKAFSERLRQSLSKTAGCCFRDQFSKALFSDLPNVSCAPDVLYGWMPRQVHQAGTGIGISLVSAKGCFQDPAMLDCYYRAVAELCDLCAQQCIPVRLFGFCTVEGDGAAIAEILRRVHRPETVETCLYQGNPERMLYELNKCETILATRFHAMILGWVLDKNVVPILYSEKQTHVLKDAGFEGPLWNALRGERLSGETLLAYAQAGRGYLDITQLRRDAAGQFADLDQFLTCDT